MLQAIATSMQTVFLRGQVIFLPSLHLIPESSCAAELLYLYRQRNSVDAATFCVFAIALMPWLQEAESAYEVRIQYSGKVSAKKG